MPSATISVTTTNTISRCRISFGSGREGRRPVPVVLGAGRPPVRPEVGREDGPPGCCGLREDEGRECGPLGVPPWARGVVLPPVRRSVRRPGYSSAAPPIRSASGSRPVGRSTRARWAAGAVGEPLCLAGRDLLEPHRQLERAGPLLGILGEAGPYQGCQRVRHALEVRLLVDHAVQHDLGTAVPEGRVGGGRVRQRGAEGEDVGGRGDGGAAHLLGREEPGGADGRTHMGEGARPGGPGDAEVDDPRALGRQQDVRGLEVPVDDARLVDGDQALGERGAHGGDLCGRQRAFLGHPVVQRGAGYVLGREPGAFGLQVRGHQARRAAAPDPPGGGHLTGEPRAELLVLGQIRPDDLERDTLPAPVRSQVDHAHAAGAEPAVQSERADDTRVLAPEPHHRHVHPADRSSC